MRPLSVCLVTHTYPPFDRGGVETYVADLARQLDAQGHRVVVFHPFESPDLPDGTVEDVDVEGIHVIRINRPRLLPHQEFGDPQVERVLRRVIWDAQVDVVHFHHLTRGLSVSLLEQAWLAGSRVVLTLHDAWVTCPRAKEVRSDGSVCPGAVSAHTCASCLAGVTLPAGSAQESWVAARSALMARALPFCDLITSPSRYQARFVARSPWITREVTARPSGVSTPVRLSARPSCGDDPLRIGVVANFVATADGHDFKGAGDLDAAVRQLGPEGPVVTVHGAADDAARRLFSTNPRIHWAGPFPPVELVGILDGLDYLLLPSKVENYPTVVREAFARKVPVICSDAGGLTEIVTDGHDGLVYAAGDPTALASLLIRVAGDRDLQGRLAANIETPVSMIEDATGWAETYAGMCALVESDSRFALTVVVATYNRPRELRRCLEGLTRQSLPRERFEVIVVDDCSAEPVDGIVSGFADALDVRLLRKEVNEGLGEARRSGVEDATGEVVLFLDDDDIAGPDCLAAHLAAHAEHPGETDAVLGFTAVHPDVELGTAMYFALVGGQRLFSYPALAEGEVPWHCGWGGRTSYKTSLLRRVPPRGRWLEDTDLNSRLRSAGLRVWYTRRAVHHLTHELSISQLRARARTLGMAATDVVARSTEPDLAALLGVAGAEQRLSHQAAEVRSIQAVADELAGHPLGALRASTLMLNGQPSTADQALWACLNSILTYETLLGHLVTARRGDGGSGTYFSALPDWHAPTGLADLVTTYLEAFDADDPVRLVLWAPESSISADAAAGQLRSVLSRVGAQAGPTAGIQVAHVPDMSAVAGAAGSLDALVWIGDSGLGDAAPLVLRLPVTAREIRQLSGLAPRAGMMALH
ncbi:MAG TPA: glycosyltransferase [Acidimicrobiales bacterium]|nr:glycosyltransferase [Acidimicrobiales bacterium]